MFDAEQYREQLVEDKHVANSLIKQREERSERYNNELLEASDAEVESTVKANEETLANTPPEEGPKPGIIGETVKATAGGIRDGFQEVIDSVAKWGNFLSEGADKAWEDVPLGDDEADTSKLPDEPKNTLELPDVAENKTAIGKVGRSLISFITVMMGASTGLGSVGVAAKLGTFGTGMVAGALTDATVFVSEKRLSNFLSEYPGFHKPVTDYLSANPDDGEALTRFKAVLEGAMLGGATDLVLNGFKYFKAIQAWRKMGVADDVIEATHKKAVQAIKGDLQDIEGFTSEVEQLRTTHVNKNITEGILEEGQDAIVKGNVIEPKPDVDVKMGENGLLIPKVKSLNDAKEISDIVTEVEKVPWTKKNKQSAKDLKRAKRRTARKIKKSKLETVEEANLYNKRAEAYLDGVVKHTAKGVTLQSSPDVGAGIAGGVIGGSNDLDGDGQLSMGDVVYGVMFGVGSYRAIKHFTKKGVVKTNKPEFDTLKTERLTELDSLSKQIDERITSGNYGREPLKRLKAHAEVVKKMQASITKADDVESLISKVKSPAVKAEIKRISEPLVKLDSKEAKASIAEYIEELKTGNYKGGTSHLDSEIFNFKRYGTTDDVKEASSILMEHLDSEIDRVKGGVQKFDMLEERAHNMGCTTEQLNKLFKFMDPGGKHSLSAQIKAAESLKHNGDVMLDELADKFRVSGSQADEIELILHTEKHAKITAMMLGIDAEGGRVLGAKRMKSVAGYSDEQIQQILAEVGGSGKILDVIDKMKSLPSARAKTQYLANFGENKFVAGALKWRYAALLSNPVTWVRNGLGNALVIANTLAEKGIAVGTSKISSAITGEAPAHTMGELNAMVHGLAESLTDTFKLAGDSAFSEAKKTFLSGDSAFDSATKIEGHVQYKDLTDENLMGKIMSTVFSTSMPSRVLQATDDLFKVICHRMSIHESSYTEAFAEVTERGLKGEELVEEMAGLITDKIAHPSEEMLDGALGLARYNTFTNELGTTGKHMQRALASHPVGRIIVPFFRTPVNIFKYVGSRTPISPTLITALKSSDKVVKEAARAKLIMGAGLFATGSMLAQKGFLTGGGPSNNKHLRQDGWQPYSMRFGDSYYSINSLDPFGGFLCIAADYNEIAQNIDPEEGWKLSEAAAVLVSASHNMLSKTYVKGMSDTLSLANEHEPKRALREGAKYFEQLGISFIVPQVVQAVERQFHPEYSEAHGFLEKLKASIPYLSKDVPAMVDVFGEDIGLQGTAFTPFRKSVQSHDEVRNKFAELGVEVNDYQMKKIDEGVGLNSKQIRRYKQLSGKLFKKKLGSLFKQDWFKDLGGEGQQTAVKRALSISRQIGRSHLFQEFPELKNEVILAKQHKFEEQNKRSK